MLVPAFLNKGVDALQCEVNDTSILVGQMGVGFLSVIGSQLQDNAIIAIGSQLQHNAA
jgi:hypothetical protein